MWWYGKIPSDFAWIVLSWLQSLSGAWLVSSVVVFLLGCFAVELPWRSILVVPPRRTALRTLKSLKGTIWRYQTVALICYYDYNLIMTYWHIWYRTYPYILCKLLYHLHVWCMLVHICFRTLDHGSQSNGKQCGWVTGGPWTSNIGCHRDNGSCWYGLWHTAETGSTATPQKKGAWPGGGNQGTLSSYAVYNSGGP